MALLYQHEPAAKVRGTLAGFFFFGAVISLGALATAGELAAEQLWAGLVLVPFALTGFALAGPVRRRFGTGGIRTALLCVVACSGVALTARALWG